MKSRHILYFTLSVFALFFVFVASVPTILSTEWARDNYLIPLLEQSSQGEVSVEDLDLSWFGTQKVQNFTWKSREDGSSIDFEMVTLKTPFYRFLFRTPILSEAQIQNLNVNISNQVTLSGFNGLVALKDGSLSLLLDGKTTKGQVEGGIVINGQLPLVCGESLIDFLLCRDESGIRAGKLHAEIKNFPSDFLNFKFSPAQISLSELIGEELNGSLHYEDGIMDVVAATNQGNVDFSVKVTQEGISFPRDGKLIYKMPGDAVSRLKERGLMAFDSPLIMTMKQGETPTIHVQIDSVSLQDGVYIKDLTGTIVLSNDLNSFKMDLNGFLDDSGGRSPLTITGDISLKPHFQYNLKAEAKELKTSLLQPFFNDPKNHIKASTLATLGYNIQASVNFYNSEHQAYVQVQLESDRAKVPGVLFKLEDNCVKLVEPANLDIEFSPTTFKNNSDIKETPIFPQNVPMTIQLKQLEIRLGKQINPEDVIIEAHISIKEVHFQNLPFIGDCSLTNGLLTLSGSSFADLQCSFIGRMNQFDDKQVVSRALGAEVRFELDSRLGFDDKWDLIVNDFDLKSDDQELNFHVSGKKDSQNPYVLHLNGEASYALLPDRFLEIQNVPTAHYQLISPTNIQLKVDKAEFDTRHPSIGTSKIKGKILVDHVDVGEGRSQAVASLSDIVIPWNFRSKSQELYFSVDAKTQNQTNSTSGKVHLQAEIDQLLTNGRIDMGQWRVNAEMAVNSFPVAIMEALFAKDGLDELMGTSLDGHLKISDKLDGEEGHVDFALKGEDFQVGGALKARQSLTLEDPEKPITFEWVMTPERFVYFRKFILKQTPALLSQLTLHQSSTIKAQLSDLSIPLSQPHQAQGTFSFETDKVSILDARTDDLVYLDGLSAQAVTQNFSRSINFGFESKGYIYNKQDENFQLSFKAAVENIMDSYGQINFSESSMKVQGYATQAPVILISNFFSIDQSVINQIDALIGHRLDAQLGMQLVKMNGPIQLNLSGTIGKLSLDGNVTQGALTLNQPLAAEVKITPRLTDSILDEILPLLNSADSSEEPIHIAISPKGFYYPLWSDNPYNFTIGSMRVDLGKIYFKNNFQMSQILSLLKFTTEDNLIPVWFTPLYLSYDKGIVYIQRVDMLVADRYPTAIWGKVNFDLDKVNLKIGLGGKTLRRAFKLKGVPNDYYLQVSLKGTTSDPNIDMGSAATRIAGFVSQFRGSPPGMIVGGIMDLLGGEKPTPKPTTSPFPWDVKN